MDLRHLLPAAGACALAAVPLRAAWPHAILMTSQPALAGRTAAGDLDVSLRFNSLIDVKRSRLVLVGADGQETRLAIMGGGGGDTMVAHARVVPGPNVLRWQVLAVDGHITRGNVPFEAAPACAKPSMAAPAR